MALLPSAALGAAVGAAPPTLSTHRSRQAGNHLLIPRIKACLQNSHPEALAWKPDLPVLALHLLQPDLHHQLPGGGEEAAATSRRLRLAARGWVRPLPPSPRGPREHSSCTLSLIPGCIPARHFVSRHWAGKKPGWHLPWKKGQRAESYSPGAVPAVLVFTTSVR